MAIYPINISTQLKDQPLKRLRYVTHFLNNHPYSKQKDLQWVINTQTGYQINYNPQIEEKADLNIIQEIYTGNFENLIANSYDIGDRNFFSVESERKTGVPFVENRVVSFDILFAIYFHISRIEELEIKQGDYLGIKSGFEKRLFSIRNKIEKFPLVDDLVEVLVKIITNQTVVKSDYLVLSHDIDHIRKFKNKLSIIRKTFGHLYHLKGWKGLKHLFATYKDYVNSKSDAFDSFDWLLSDNPSHKRIYYLVGGKHRNDTPYPLNNPVFIKSVKLAVERGYQIGIHPSFQSWNSYEIISEEKTLLQKIIGQKIFLSRQHFLNFDIAVTPALLLKAGIKEDSSLGFTRFTGYRCGTAYPYHLYDFENEGVSELMELPLIFMDSAWMHEFFGDSQNSFEISLNRFRGCFNFHNTFFDEMAARNLDLKEIYLEYIQSHD